MYAAYQAQQDLLAPFRAWSEFTNLALRDTNFGPVGNQFLRNVAAGAELFSRARVIHERPDYNIDSALVEGRDVPVHEYIALVAPFGNLLHFRKETNLHQPRVLIVAPMAGHFPTLLRQTAQTMLADHDVYITDWKSARDVPRIAGRFGMDDYIAQIIKFVERIGPGTHVVAAQNQSCTNEGSDYLGCIEQRNFGWCSWTEAEGFGPYRGRCQSRFEYS